YVVRVLSHAKTFVKTTSAPGDSAGFLLISMWQGRPIFIRTNNANGFALGGLDNVYFLMQIPASDNLNAFPKDEKEPKWVILPTRKQGDAFEIGYLDEKAAQRASIALLGSKQECDSEGKCKEVPVVQELTKSPETNRAILK